MDRKKFIEPWEALEDKEGFIVKELERELCAEHVLYSVKAVAVAEYTAYYDDFLFELSDFTHKYAIVHLTWSKEKSPQWPSTSLYKDFEEFKEKVMIPNHKEFLEEAD